MKLQKKEYEGKFCPTCGSDIVYVIHIINEKDPENVEADLVYCKCEKCGRFQLNRNYSYFSSVESAIKRWNTRGRY